MRTVLSLIVTSAVLWGGCVADSAQSSSLVILKNQPPDDSCNVSSVDTGVFLGAGVLDTSISNTYVMTPLIELRTQAFDPSDRLTRSVTIEGAEINIEGDSFTQLFSVVMEPESTIGAFFTILDNGRVNASDGETVTAEIKVFGNSAGSDVESNTFTYPIDVCDGCLGQSLATFLPSCDGFTLPCLAGQDDISCCQDDTGAAICP